MQNSHVWDKQKVNKLKKDVKGTPTINANFFLFLFFCDHSSSRRNLASSLAFVAYHIHFGPITRINIYVFFSLQWFYLFFLFHKISLWAPCCTLPIFVFTLVSIFTFIPSWRQHNDHPFLGPHHHLRYSDEEARLSSWRLPQKQLNKPQARIIAEHSL